MSDKKDELLCSHLEKLTLLQRSNFLMLMNEDEIRRDGDFFFKFIDYEINISGNDQDGEYLSVAYRIGADGTADWSSDVAITTYTFPPKDKCPACKVRLIADDQVSDQGHYGWCLNCNKDFYKEEAVM